MNANLEVRILLPSDREAILAFAQIQLRELVADQMEREMQSWNARWRPEALDYYLPQGWSFGAFLQGKMVALALGQPLLFYRGLTQTLWVEELLSSLPEATNVLLDTLYKWAKDKHLQCVLLESRPDREHIIESWPKALLMAGPMIEIRTSRF
ncbi:MAG: hypothetical protein AB7F86_20100 [Bdellovibrionales bacterium]